MILVFVVERKRRNAKAQSCSSETTHNPKLSQKTQNSGIEMLMFVSHSTASSGVEKVLC